jgi:NADP-dependent 3-hydroxy acid dehydrogenase YdfG
MSERPVAVVSGAGSGIGAAIARALGERGWRLGLVGRRKEPLAAVLAASGGAGIACPVDVRDAEKVALCAAKLPEKLGAPELVVAAAGVARVGRFAELDPAAFRETVETNLLGAAHLFRAFLPGMLERRRGTLVAVLSVAARRVFPGWSAYAASKWGLLGLVESLREELAGSGVRVLALTPGATATPLWESIEGEWERARMIPADEVARALLWALDAGEGAAIEEIRMQPPGGNL